MINPNKQTWKVWLGVGIVLSLFGILNIYYGNNILSSILLGLIFLCISYNSYKFSKKQETNVGRNLTIVFGSLFLISFILSMIDVLVGFFYISSFFIAGTFILTFIFLIYWYFENKQIMKFSK